MGRSRKQRGVSETNRQNELTWLDVCRVAIKHNYDLFSVDNANAYLYNGERSGFRITKQGTVYNGRGDCMTTKGPLTYSQITQLLQMLNGD